MADKKYVTLEKEAFEKMCGLIRESYSVADAIDDENISTESTYSSKTIENKITDITPTIVEDENNDADTYKLNITTRDGTITTPNLKENNAKTYTSLADLGLTAPVTVGDIFNAMDDKTIAMIACEGTNYHITDIPGYYGILTIKRAKLGRFSIEFQSSSAMSATDVKRWIGTLKGTDGTELTWKLISTQTTYVALSDMELTAEATVQDVIDALPIGCTALLRTDEFTNWSTLFNDIQYGYLKIEKTVNGLSNIELQEVISPNRRYFGTQVGGNFDKWQKPIDQFYGIITQEKDGYFKFKPCSDPKTQGIRITATDNYGGMIDISGVAPTQTQYKPFKCVRLSHGTYTDYNASNPTSNKMEKLFFLNGYMYLKIVAYTTVTFTNLIEEPTFVETIEEGAEEIPIRSVFDIPYNDGYADPSIIVIGDTNSDNGVIKTLDTLGFTKDIMTWDTGVYRVSHVSGLTGLPSDITNATPSFRLEHHNIKKWGNGHNPSKSTLGQRHSIIYCDNGNIYQRFYTSGDTAGVYTNDTGWRKIIVENSKTDPYSCTGYKALTGTEDLFTLPCGHYVSDKINTAYNYPITDSSNATAHIYVLGCLNEPANNKGYRIILYFDNKNRMYRINEWWGSFSNGWKEIITKDYVDSKIADLQAQINALK